MFRDYIKCVLPNHQNNAPEDPGMLRMLEECTGRELSMCWTAYLEIFQQAKMPETLVTFDPLVVQTCKFSLQRVDVWAPT